MMKFKNYMMGIATVTLLATMASCQNNDEVNPTPEVQAPVADETTMGFMSFSVGMPNNGVTRANDNFYDGSENEYTVENVTLVLFAGDEGGNEDDAVLVSAYNLSSQRTSINFMQTSGTSDDQITSATDPNHLIAEVRKADLVGKQAYAFIIVNDHQYVTVNEAEHSLYSGADGKLFDTTTGNNFTANKDLKGTKFGVFRKLCLIESGRNFAGSSFFMCNAPVANMPASASATAGKIHTLVPFGVDKIYRDENTAKQNPACAVNIERALAKVDCTFNLASGYKIDTKIPVDLLYWDLDNTNNVCYVARKMSDNVSYMTWSSTKGSSSLPYRFTSSSEITTTWTGTDHSSHAPAYRTYWAEDANYADDVTAFNVKMTTLAGKPTDEAQNNKIALTNLRGSGDTFYTTENTFDVEHQTVKNTTRLVVAAKINEGKPFFTLMENAKELYNHSAATDAYTTPGTIQKFLSDALANRVSVHGWAKQYLTNPDDSDWAKNLFRIEFVDELPAAELNETGSEPIKAPVGRKIAKISLADQATYTGFGSNYAAALAAFEAIRPVQQAYLYDSYPLHYYPGGIAYYQVLIKHFGDQETPWTADDNMVNIPVGTNAIYGSNVDEANRDFLGRYGIVRNNWYSLEVTGVSAIGSSVVPPLTDDPDDTVRNYMTVHVNILPWVKREQTGIVL